MKDMGWSSQAGQQFVVQDEYYEELGSRPELTVGQCYEIIKHEYEDQSMTCPHFYTVRDDNGSVCRIKVTSSIELVD